MADLFHKQAKFYADTRPNYPTQLFDFIASKTPNHDIVWDAGTGSGQAALSLAGIYKNVIATDTSNQQLAQAPKHPNIRYQQTPPTMSVEELARNVTQQGTVDLVTVAQAFHWFDHSSFYQQVKWVLKRPHGVLAVWCYTEPQVDDSVDAVFWRLYNESAPFWDPARQIVDQKYTSFDFPFELVEGTDNTGPFQFEAQKPMDLDTYLTYIRSWSAYQTARQKGVELLREEVIQDFKLAWGGEGKTGTTKVVRYPIFLRIGRVAN